MSPVRIIAALCVCLAGCSGGMTGGAACCPISEEAIPGACVELGGAVPPPGRYCPATCDGPNDFVRIIDEQGCPKFVCAPDAAPPSCF